MMALDLERLRLLRLAGHVEALRQELDDLQGKVAHVHGRAQVLAQETTRTSEASVALKAAINSLSQRIRDELQRGRSDRNIVFVVDDDAEPRGRAADALTSAGFAVQGFARAEELIEVLPVAMPRAVVIDLKLPGMPGPTLAEYLRTNPRTARVYRVGMTTFVPSTRDTRSFSSLIEKPFDEAALVDVVRRSLPRSSRLSASRRRT
jgi:CheY-like chemotaxis protein